ncbi:hypothetical protein TNCV_854191 [Trichonephila clavipes]|nr:hypothetical protein TNCV_854191 [Trichonephila clavipes]
MRSTATQSKASSTFASMLPREVMQPCLLLQMKCQIGLMRLPLINKDDTLAARQCGACSTFPSIKGIQQFFTWQYILKEAKEYTMNHRTANSTFD